MNTIIAVLAVQGQHAKFVKTLRSLTQQKPHRPEIIVVSSSNEQTFAKEAKICDELNITLIRADVKSNRSARFNRAIRELVRTRMIESEKWITNIFVGFYVPGDAIAPNRYANCWTPNETYDVLYARHSTKATKKDDSLWETTNPNAFIVDGQQIARPDVLLRLTLLLEIGLFDELLPALSWRDMLVRMAMAHPPAENCLQHPQPKYVPEYLHPDFDEQTIQLSLARFYHKHRGLINQQIQQAYFATANKDVTFNEKIFNASIASEVKKSHEAYEKRVKQLPAPWGRLKPKAKFNGTLRFAFVTSDVQIATKTIVALDAIDYAKKEIYVFANFDGAKTGNDKIFGDVNTPVAVIFATPADNPVGDGRKFTPALARDLLCHRLASIVKKGDVTILIDHAAFLPAQIKPDDCQDAIISLINYYLNQDQLPDVISLPNYSINPEPFAATPRIALISKLYYGAYGKHQNAKYHRALIPEAPAPFDATLTSDTWRENPDCHQHVKASINDIMTGAPLLRAKTHCGAAEALFGSGCAVLVFNNEVLRVPHALGQLNGLFGHKNLNVGLASWLVEIKRRGFEVAHFSEPVFGCHTTNLQKPYDYREAARARLKRMVVSTYCQTVVADNFYLPAIELAKKYVALFKDNLVNLVLDFARTFGLLNMLAMKDNHEAQEWRHEVNPETLAAFIDKASVNISSLRHVVRMFEKQRATCPDVYGWQAKAITTEIQRRYGKASRRFKADRDAFSVCDDALTYRVLHGPYGKNKKLALRLLAKLPAHATFEPPQIIQLCGSPTFVYRTHQAARAYHGGHARQMGEFLYFLKRNGCTLINVTQADFMILNNQLHFIGYGVNLLPYSTEAAARAEAAAYACLGDNAPPLEVFNQVVFKS